MARLLSADRIDELEHLNKNAKGEPYPCSITELSGGIIHVSYGSTEDFTLLLSRIAQDVICDNYGYEPVSTPTVCKETKGWTDVFTAILMFRRSK